MPMTQYLQDSETGCKTLIIKQGVNRHGSDLNIERVI